MKLNIWKFALAGGIFIAFWAALITLSGLLGIPGASEFVTWLAQFAAPYGYSVSWTGVLVGTAYGFVKGYIAFGIFAWLYNALV